MFQKTFLNLCISIIKKMFIKSHFENIWFTTLVIYLSRDYIDQIISDENFTKTKICDWLYLSFRRFEKKF